MGGSDDPAQEQPLNAAIVIGFADS